MGARAELGNTADFTAVLHAGPLAYGNIGAPDRLDFTVIGSAVNAASRIETVAKRLGEPTVASAAVAELLRPPLAQPRPARAARRGRALGALGARLSCMARGGEGGGEERGGGGMFAASGLGYALWIHFDRLGSTLR